MWLSYKKMFINSGFILLTSGFFLSVFGRYVGIRGASIISVISCIISSIIALFSFYECNIYHQQSYIVVNNWFSINTLEVCFDFYYNSCNSLMASMVTSITTCIMFFAIIYMINDPHIIRFVCYLKLFAGFMLVLIYSNNLALVLLGWEGIGIISFQLIGFWFSRIEASKSALKAIIVNKISDVFLMLSTGIFWWNNGSLNFSNIIIESNINNVFLSIIIIVGCMAKSSLFILHTWLADAMEGPTPVSALIHAATLVTAGILILSKCSILFTLHNFSKHIILIIGSFTALTSAMIGLYQTDIKKTIAFSTCSQLGYMVIAIGILQPNIAIYHTITHAYFKAGLFLIAGTIITSSNSQQDYRLAGSISLVNWLSIAISIVISSLCGSFFTAGYYSKDLIIEYGSSINEPITNWSIYILIIGIVLTSWYSSELQLINLLYNKNASIINTYRPFTNILFIIPIFFLTIFSLWLGILLENGWSSELNFINYINVEFTTKLVSLIPIFCVIIGSYLCLNNNNISIFLYIWLNSRMGFDWIYNKIISGPLIVIAYLLDTYFEKGVLEMYNEKYIIKILSNLYSFINKIIKNPFKQTLILISLLCWLNVIL
jgi:proton-translocating NADH-quinone oxidoreductase chain L